jgi:4-amino-4-deoxy-L-arabinose transferase-like glycosyltransferase
LALLAAFALLLFSNLDKAPFERAEIYFLDGARSMVETGDWLVPLYRGQPFFDKPVLTYALMAAAFRGFGFSPGVARVVPACAALGVLGATVWLGVLLVGRRAALAGGVVLASTLAFAVFGRVAMSDMLLALWTTLAVAFAVRFFRDGSSAAVVGTLAALGLGFQTKGPIALLLPGLALLLLAARAPSTWLRALRPGPVAAGLALFAITGLGWFAAVYARLGMAPLEYFFLRENLQRFAAETYDSGRPFWYYLATYAAEGLPWSLFLPLAVRRLRHEEPEARRSIRFLLAWVGLMLVPLSLSRGKIDYYLLPLYPALSLVIGRFFAARTLDGFERAYCRIALTLMAAALATFPFAGRAIAPEWRPAPWAMVLLVAITLAAASAILLAGLRARPQRMLAALAGSAAALFLGVFTLFLPAFWAAQPNRAIARDVARELAFRPDAEIAACADPTRVERDLLFHVRVVVAIRCDLWGLASSRTPYLFLLRPEERASFTAVPGFREIARYRHLPSTVFTMGGLLSRPEPGEMTLAANFMTDDPVADTKRKKDRKRGLREEWGP